MIEKNIGDIKQLKCIISQMIEKNIGDMDEGPGELQEIFFKPKNEIKFFWFEMLSSPTTL
ncbi:hypothetical protein CL614_09700 [archaeon]|nr:hypothetical protein [archaeon]